MCRPKQNQIVLLWETCKLFTCGVAVCAHFSGGQHWRFHSQAMATFVGIKHFKTELLPTMTSLCKDPHHVVRKTVASGFHEVSRQCGGRVTGIIWMIRIINSYAALCLVGALNAEWLLQLFMQCSVSQELLMLSDYYSKYLCSALSRRSS